MAYVARLASPYGRRMAGTARTQRDAVEQETAPRPATQPALAPAARVISLQRSAGNQAVGQLLRLKAGERDDLLELVLRGAALDAFDAAHNVEGAKDRKAATKLADDAKHQLYN